MKKRFALVGLFAAAGLLSVGVLASCGETDTRVADIIAQAEKMDKEELYKKAMDEIDGQTFTVVANSSRMKNAFPNWVTYCQDNLKSESFHPEFAATYVGTQPKNNQIFSQIKSDVTGAAHTIDMTLIQDGSQIKSKMTTPGYLLNYIPKEWAGDKAKDGEPLALQSLNKVFCYNTNHEEADPEPNYNNVWDFALKVKTQFMTPKSEPVGQNFLYMLTRDDYAAYVKDAYDALDAADKTTVDKMIAGENDTGIPQILEENPQFGPNVKYSLAWIYAFLKNYTAVSDDGPISENITKRNAGGSAGLLVYSKFRSITETEAASCKIIKVAAHEDGYKGFGGYMYKHYLQILRSSPHPWTSCAMINFMVTEYNGFQPWGKDAGGYSSNPTLMAQFDHSQDGYVGGVNDCDVKNDRGYDWWVGSAANQGRLIVEDGEYASTVASALADWIAYI